MILFVQDFEDDKQADLFSTAVLKRCFYAVLLYALHYIANAQSRLYLLLFNF